MQKSFCARAMFTVLVSASAMQVNADCGLLESFRETGSEYFSAHGAFRDLFLKTALHEFVKEHLPNSPFFKLGSQDFELQDIFVALSNALADVADATLFSKDAVNYHTTVRHAFIGHAAHKLWLALLDVVGVSKHISDDVKKQYNRYGKAWFSKAFALSLDKAYASIRKS